MEDSRERLYAFCSITIDDCFVIRDLKIIEGQNGPFVSMPSRKLMAHCPRCHFKNHLRAAYCNQCGSRLPEDFAVKDDSGRTKLFADIAHPSTWECRDMLQQVIIAAYREELRRSKEPGYVSSYRDIDGDARPAANVPSTPHAAPPAPTSVARPTGDGKQSTASVCGGRPNQQADAPVDH
jgi:stage V sporulation protein G